MKISPLYFLINTCLRVSNSIINSGTGREYGNKTTLTRCYKMELGPSFKQTTARNQLVAQISKLNNFLRVEISAPFQILYNTLFEFFFSKISLKIQIHILKLTILPLHFIQKNISFQITCKF